MSSEACTRVPVHMCATFSWLRPGVPPSSGCNQELTAAARSATFSWLQPGVHGCDQECHLLLAQPPAYTALSSAAAGPWPRGCGGGCSAASWPPTTRARSSGASPSPRCVPRRRSRRRSRRARRCAATCLTWQWQRGRDDRALLGGCSPSASE